jgi:aspartate aminotransferase
MKTASRLDRVRPSPTLAVTQRAAELRAQGRDIIGLGAGEPDFDTPEHIREAGVRAIEDGQTRYTAVGGTPALKAAIVDKLQRDNGFDYTPAQVLVSVGAKHSLYNLCQALLDDGDEVIVPAPYWVSYPDMALLAGAEVTVIECSIGDHFKMQPEQLAAAITPRTRLLILNSPSNPTGAAYTRAELEAIGEVLRQHPEMVVVTDDIYEDIYWADEPFCNILMACPDLVDRCVVVNGVSKTYAMTGWRIGYAAGPEALIKAMTKLQSQSTSNPCSISQAAAVAAISGDQSCLAPMLQAFHERHDAVISSLAGMPGVHCRPGEGTFYAFPDFGQAIADMDGIDDDLGLAARLLDEAGVALVPGSAFGAPGHMRLSFATDMDTLNMALQRISDLLRSD